MNVDYKKNDVKGFVYFELSTEQAKLLFNNSELLCGHCNESIKSESVIYLPLINDLMDPECANIIFENHSFHSDDKDKQDRYVQDFINLIKVFKLFYAYADIQIKGDYNMITDADKIMHITGLTASEYKFVMDNYKVLRQRFSLTWNTLEKIELEKLINQDKN